jgi:hypothetical protein
MADNKSTTPVAPATPTSTSTPAPSSAPVASTPAPAVVTDTTTKPAEPTAPVSPSPVVVPVIPDATQPATPDVVDNADLPAPVVNTSSANATTPVTSDASSDGVVDAHLVEGILADKVAEAAKVTDTSTSTDAQPVVSDFMKSLDELKASGSLGVKALISAFEKYTSDMKPGAPMDEDKGVLNQFYFWNSIYAVLEKTPREEFKQAWSVILGFFKEHEETVFSDRYVFRFLDMWKWDEDSLTCYQRIVNLIKQTADPATRADGVKQVDFGRTLEVLLTEEAKAKINLFYGKS